MNVFEDLGISNQLLESIKRLGHSRPTAIQEQSIPHIIVGKDVIGESATGSGKTLAFGCGIVEHVTPGEGIQAVILTPTRELAEQVKNSLIKLSYQKPLKIINVYGGVPIDRQIHDLASANVVVATPGRLLDHLTRGTFETSKVKLLVLDEADRMFDMGFIEDVELIIRSCPSKRQTLFFSATIPSRIRQLANRYMTNPAKVFTEKVVDPSKLKQFYYNVPKNFKLSLLVHLLQQEKSELAMVFCNSRKNADFVSKNLKANGINAIAIHGGFSQNKRNKTIKLFNEAKARVLVCTDVAARGLHVDNVSHVYNYDIPRDSNDYVHRIGRTARAGEEGKAINILCEYDHDNFSKILNQYRNFTIDKLEKPYLKRIRVAGFNNPGHAPRNSGYTPRNSGHAPRNSGHAPRRKFFHRRR